jgi:RNA polymerase sigma-70 factor (ECF subfamily)
MSTIDSTTYAVTDSDLFLLERFREDGDQEAFAEIVRRYAAAVFSTSVRILGDKARADDVSQETFFRLSQRPEAVKQSLGGWLHTAATRLAIDAVRSDASRAQREANYERKPASDSMQWADVSPHVDEALAELADETRMLLVRHFLQNVSQCQLAGELGTSPATVSRKIKAGVEQLRKQLNRKGITIAAALLITLMREHGAQACPTLLVRELGKITMISGGKPAGGGGAAGAAAGNGFACGLWWVTAIASLALVWFALCMALPSWPRPAPAQQQNREERHAEHSQAAQQRADTVNHPAVGG